MRICNQTRNGWPRKNTECNVGNQQGLPGKKGDRGKQCCPGKDQEYGK